MSVLRRKAGLSQTDLAEKLGVTSQAVSKWECGNAVSDIDILLELSHLYKVTINEMLSEIAYPIKDDIYYQRAIKYANPTEASRYQKIADKCQAVFDFKNLLCAVYCDNTEKIMLFTKTERGKYLKNYRGSATIEISRQDTVFHIEKQKYTTLHTSSHRSVNKITIHCNIYKYYTVQVPYYMTCIFWYCSIK